MFPYFVFGVFLVVGLVLLARWFVDADPKTLARAARHVGIVLVLLVVVVLLVTGRLTQALAALFFLAPLLMRWRAVWNRVKAAGGPAPGQTSGISTATLEMQLDHDSGAMAGRVLRGQFEGRELASLARDDVLALLEECRVQDPQSVPVLEAYLDRTFGTDWRGADEGGEAAGGTGQRARPSEGAMTRDEAYSVLGLEPGADREAITAAHRRMMKNLHPDHGGSDYLAAKLNEAKAVLLGK
ncbi:MAG: DnaJ domain-containing protein [Inquilinus sp.]|nr:DnaJ domain-containing protein [Inquilinus sp.]